MRRVESVETSAAKLGRPAQHGTAGAMAGLTRVYQNRAAHSQVACHWSLARGHGDNVTMEHGTRMLVYTLSTSPAPCLAPCWLPGKVRHKVVLPVYHGQPANRSRALEFLQPMRKWETHNKAS